MPELGKMTGRVLDLGPKPGVAAAYKLFGNLTLIGMMGVVADVVRLASAVGVAPADAVAMFKEFNPGQFLSARAAKVASGPYEPASFTVAMARKDVRLMIDEAASHGVALAVMPSVAALYDAAIARGESGRDTSAAFRYPFETLSHLPPRLRRRRRRRWRWEPYLQRIVFGAKIAQYGLPASRARSGKR